MEKRFVELRGPFEGRTLTGYAARFGQPARIGTFTETIRQGAFRASLGADKDVLALADHDPKRVLGRTRTGSLKLTEDDQGLRFDLTLPDTSAGNDVLALATRGDLGGASFGFTVPKGGEVWNGDRRELRQVDLREISLVSSWPAYETGTIHVRAKTPKLNRARRLLEVLK
jgi:uncharacterized protein